jgi:hypothetical protein
MVTTRRSGKSSDKEELTTRKSTRRHDEEIPQPRLDEEFLIEGDQGTDMVGSGGGENNDSGDEMPEQVTFATGKQVRMLT